MPVLANYTQQPAERLDYDFDFADWLADKGADQIASVQVVTDNPALVVSAVTFNGPVVKAFVSGGLDGVTYKITCTITTTGSRIRQVEFKLKVKED